MSETSVRRLWTCAHCGARSSWRSGWSWKLSGPVETLDSFTANCSPKCAAASPEKQDEAA